MIAGWIRPLFLIAGLYDALLGLAFFFGHEPIFAYFGVTPPNHPAYIEFPAALLVVFGVMFFHIASDPVRLRPLIPYGIALKVAYAGLAILYQVTGGIPSMWLPWAWMDLCFLLAFAVAWTKLAAGQARA